MILTTRRLFAAIFFIALFVMATREIADPDFWWHLSAGKFIVETQSIPHVDVFSFTNAGRPWVMHEWLSEVFIFALYSFGSFPLLILTFAGIITLAFIFVYARMPGKPYLAAFALLLAAVATAPTWGVRPQMFSLLLACVFLWILEGDLYGRPYIWLLPPLMILWVNLHSGYALGIVIIGVYLFGGLMAVIASREAAKQHLHRTPSGVQVSPITSEIASSHTTLLAMTQPPLRTLALVFIACLLAVFINPNGATMYLYPFETLTSPTMQAYIQEWFSPDFHRIEFQPFAWLLLATLASIALSGKRASLTQTILLIGFGYAGLRSARNIPFFAIVAAPILAEQLAHLIESRGWLRTMTNARTTRGMVIVNWLLLAIIALAGVARVAMVISNQQVVEHAKFPAAAVDFLQAQKIDGALYNAYDWGGYLMWRLHPQTRVFIDGRADVYGDGFIEQVYLKAYRGGADWREPLERYKVNVVLIEPDAPLAGQLARDAAWEKVYADKLAVVWERK